MGNICAQDKRIRKNSNLYQSNKISMINHVKNNTQYSQETLPTDSSCITKLSYLIIGDCKVGKTCFLRMIETGQFEPKYYPTSDFCHQISKKCIYNEGVMTHSISFREINVNTMRMYPKGIIKKMDGVLLMYNSLESLDNLIYNLNEFITYNKINPKQINLICVQNLMSQEDTKILDLEEKFPKKIYSSIYSIVTINLAEKDTQIQNIFEKIIQYDNQRQTILFKDVYNQNTQTQNKENQSPNCQV